jgi:transposase
VEWLPPYAPELNPEEYCHGNVKQRLKNATPANALQICRMLDRGFARLRRRPDLLLSFVHEAGLTVKQLWLT